MEIPRMQWFFDRAGSADSSRIALPAMLPSAFDNNVGTLDSLISRLNSPACTYPFQRFASVLTDVNAWFGATVVRYSFDVGLLHSFLHAGLSRRSTNSTETPARISIGDITPYPRYARRPWFDDLSTLTAPQRSCQRRG
jgi:hypothetical protein